MLAVGKSHACGSRSAIGSKLHQFPIPSCAKLTDNNTAARVVEPQPKHLSNAFRPLSKHSLHQRMKIKSLAVLVVGFGNLITNSFAATRQCCTQLPLACLMARTDCDTGWNLYSGTGNCFQWVTGSPRTWAAAEADCVSKGGHLASISDLNENLFAYAPAASSVGAWLGATKSSGSWKWVDGASTSYLLGNWKTSEPNGIGNSFCTFYCCGPQDANAGRFADTSCSETRNYICKKPVACPPGHFESGTLRTCVKCPVGRYHPDGSGASCFQYVVGFRS